jgi:FkbH-like protein
MLHQLPWLPVADAHAFSRLKEGAAVAGQDGLRLLQTLSNYGWSEPELRRLGRQASKTLAGLAVDRAVAARSAGLVPFRLLVLSSNTLSHAADALRGTALRVGIALDLHIVEYEQPEVWIGANGAVLADQPPDATLISLDRKILGLKSQPGLAEESEAAIEQALERVTKIAVELQRRTGRAVIIQTLTPDGTDPQSSMDAWLPGGARAMRAEFNQRLAILAREHSHLLFDAAAIADIVGQSVWSAGRYWYVAKYPFSIQCLPLYADRLMRLIAAMLGKSKKVLVLDLDNTLWGGVVGDDGFDGIVLGQGNARGEAHLAIQRMALDYKERGIVLAIASKNTEDTALNVIRRHPEMLIREDDITIFAIDWNDKASNIKAIGETLELGLDSFVFLDDNPAERKQVRDTLPMVAAPELPDDPSGWLPVFQAAAYFEQVSFSSEDKKRADYYKGNARRAGLAKTVGDHASFLASLNMTMTVAPFDDVGRARIAQLIAKTNQFNLTTRRYSETEVAKLAREPRWETLQVRLEDMFGDNGMISVVICERGERAWRIDTWLMSCRVLGRGVEEAVLNILAVRARAAGAQEIRGRYIPTPKNGLVRDHFQKLGFARIAETVGGETEWLLELSGWTPRTCAIKTVVSGPPANAAG